jgi:hypothetical protein
MFLECVRQGDYEMIETERDIAWRVAKEMHRKGKTEVILSGVEFAIRFLEEVRKSQGPVAWMKPDGGEVTTDCDAGMCGWIPLFTIQPTAIPEGWQPVPKEPTEEMLSAAHKHYENDDSYTGFSSTYRVMLVAAPKLGENHE